MRTAEAMLALNRLLEVMVFRRRDRALAAPIRRATKALRSAFLGQGSVFIKRLDKRLREALTLGPWEADFDAASLETLQMFTEPLGVLAEAALAAGIREALADVEVGIDFDLSNPRAVDYLTNYAANLVKGLNDTSKMQMRTLLTQAVDEGWSYGKTATAIRQEFVDFSRQRALMISVNEAGNAYEHGNLLVAQELADTGLEMEKSWLRGGNAECEICGPNSDERWIPLEQAFSSGHDRPMGHPHCLCSMLTRRKPKGG